MCQDISKSCSTHLNSINMSKVLFFKKVLNFKIFALGIRKQLQIKVCYKKYLVCYISTDCNLFELEMKKKNVISRIDTGWQWERQSKNL